MIKKFFMCLKEIFQKEKFRLLIWLLFTFASLATAVLTGKDGFYLLALLGGIVSGVLVMSMIVMAWYASTIID